MLLDTTVCAAQKCDGREISQWNTYAHSGWWSYISTASMHASEETAPEGSYKVGARSTMAEVGFLFNSYCVYWKGASKKTYSLSIRLGCETLILYQASAPGIRVSPISFFCSNSWSPPRGHVRPGLLGWD